MLGIWIACVALVLYNVGCRANFVNLSPTSHIRGRKYIQPFDESTVTKDIHARISTQLVPPSEKVAAIVVFSFPLFANGTHPRLPALRCSLHKLYTNVAQFTPLDLYLFVNESTIQYVPSWLNDDFPGSTVVPIDNHSWQIPPELSPTGEWMYGKVFKEGYHLMGRWRLTYAPAFTRSLGYRYMLFVDDDALVIHPIEYNLVQLFDEHQIALAHRNKVLLDIPEPLSGIAELARYWMVTRNVTEPFGPLFEHMTPPNIEGLSSVGWDRYTFQTSFMVLNLDFWYEEPVQDFLDLVFSTGGDLMQRWLEQGVMNIVRLLFLQNKHVLMFPQTAMLHDKIVDPRIFRLLNCDFVNSAPAATSSSNGLSSTTLSADGSTVARTNNAVQQTNLGKIEFLIIWEHADVKPVATEKLKELFLFHWLYNLTSCGADTATLNDYQLYLTEAQDRNLRMYWWWHEFEVDNKLNAILAHDSHINESATMNSAGIIPAAQESSEGCRAVLRSQLVQYVEFYCAYTGIHQGRPMAEYCENIRRSVLQAYDSQQPL